jgi:hypothetical protein
MMLNWPERVRAESVVPASPEAIQSVFPLAGLTVELENPEQRADGSIYARHARLVAPQAFGGGFRIVNDVTVRNGVVSIGSTRFDLPRFDFAGFAIGLEGQLTEGPNGEQLISASGIFAVPHFKALPPCTGISIAVTLAATPDVVTGHQQVTMTIISLNERPATLPAAGGPYSPEYIEGLELREAALELRCSIPIGTTGFVLKRVDGKVTLNANNTTIQLGAEVATAAKVLVAPILSADGRVTLDTNPFKLALEGGLKLFKFPVASGSAAVWPEGFRGSLTVEIILARGQVEVSTWVADERFHMRGSGYVELGIEKGVVVKGKCFKLFRKIPILKKICTPPVPPFNTPKARVEARVGEFTNGAWGFAGTARIAKWDVGFYIDTEGNKSFKNVDQYKLVTPPQVEAAHAAWVAAAAAGVDAATARTQADFTFASPTEVFPVSTSVVITQPSELIFSLAREGSNPQLTLIMPDGTEVTPTTLPETIAYTEYFTTTVDEEEEIVTTDQYYFVADAQPGTWQAVLSGEPGETDLYLFEVLGHPEGPIVQSGGGVVASHAANDTATITWQLTAHNPDTRVAIYVNPGLTSHTFMVDNADGTTETLQLPLYTGIELADNLETTEDNSPQSYTVAVDELESGTYAVWLEVDDGINDPVQVYLSEPLVIDNSADWSATWSPTISVTTDYDAADITWTPHPSADVDYYTVYVGDAPGTANPEEAIDSFVLGADEGFDLFGLEGNATYYVAIGANDTDIPNGGDNGDVGDGDGIASATTRTDGRMVLSPEVAVTTKSVSFQLIPSAGGPLTLAQGQSATTSFTVHTDVADFPDELFFYENCASSAPPTGQQLYLPQVSHAVTGARTRASTSPGIACRESDGFQVAFDRNHLLPSAQGEVVTVTISTGTAQPGVYTIPIVAESNNTMVSLSLEVTVTPAVE